MTRLSAHRRFSPAVLLATLLLVAALLLAGCEDGTTSTPQPTREGGEEQSWWQVYFTEPDRLGNPDQIEGSIEAALIERIDAAQESIHIAAFEFNLTPVAEALIAAKGRDVEVQWVTDDEHGLEADSEEGHGQFAMLQDADIPVIDDGRGALMHNKFIIFDGQTVWTGATNLTENGIFRNNNNVIVIESGAVAEMFEREFSEMWAGEFGPRSPSTVSQQRTTVEGTPIQVLFASEDEAVSQIVPLLQSAQQSIYFMAFSFTHNDLGEAMLERAAEGVTVSGIFETRGSQTEFSELPPMFCAGLAVRQDGNPSTYHHKVIVIDEQTVITGSLNFSANADESNDENVVILTNPAIAAQYLQEFQRNWAEANPPDPAEMNCP